jgi:adenylyltransferase/sulfurtransferase
VFPEIVDADEASRPETVGVLGPVPGTIGCLQAIEVIKLVTGAGEPLIGRLLLFDARGLRFDAIRIERHPGCPVCGGG